METSLTPAPIGSTAGAGSCARAMSPSLTSLYWPSCQILDLPDTEDGTFSVTYRYGQDPPVSGQHAAAALACEFYRACGGGGGTGDCDLPQTAVRVTRQGVSIDKTVAVDWFLERRGIRGWKTGILAVDGFLNSVNPDTMRRAAADLESGWTALCKAGRLVAIREAELRRF